MNEPFSVGVDRRVPLDFAWHSSTLEDVAVTLGLANETHEGDPLGSSGAGPSGIRMQQQPASDVLRRGLISAVVETRGLLYGSNVIPVPPGRHPLTILASHFLNSITLIFSVIAAVSIWLEDWGELGVVVFVIFINGILGFSQEYSADKSINSLKKMTSGTAAVIRDQTTKIIPVDEVVIGDTVVLGQGDFVPADLRLVDVSSLEIDESLLTGEPLPVRKHSDAIPDPDGHCALGDRKNLAFRGTTVTNGRGVGVCVCAGTETQVGRISKSLSSSESTATPLQRKMQLFLWSLFGCCGVIVLIVFAANDFSGDGTVILYAAAVAVAILPEALTTVITVAMTVAVQRMVQGKCIVRKLAAIEVLGGVTDICSDKTGTLTQNKMTVLQFSGSSGRVFGVRGLPMSVWASITREGETPSRGMSPASTLAEDISAMSLIRCASLCSATVLNVNDDGVLDGTGNPTEVAIQALAMKFDMGRTQLLTSLGIRQLREFPFDSTVKRMSVVMAQQGVACDTATIYCKGAPERILSLCDSKVAHDGSVAEMLPHDRVTFSRLVEELAQQGLRTVMFAEKRVSLPESTGWDNVAREDVENAMTFVGIVGICDPPRPETADAVHCCQMAGIRVRMLTGDHLETAKAIACEIGIISHSDKDAANVCMEGPIFDKLTEEELDALPELPLVVGRCSPETKVKMVDTLHRRKCIVAMTGDGFNDSASIKRADIGCAMGSGTDVTKAVAELVITDDNFATIVRAVVEGRRVFGSISKFIIHLLSSNVAEVIVLVLGLPLKHQGFSIFILSPLQILWLNMFTGSPPATGLSMDKPDPDILLRPPNRQGMFTKELILDTIVYGILLGVPTLCSFIITLYGFKDGVHASAVECNKPDGENCDNVWEARATAYSVLYIGLLLHAYNVRHPRMSIFHMQWFDNPFLWGSVAFGMVTLVPMLYVEPIATNVFVHRRVTWEWGVIGSALLIFMATSEGYKCLKRRFMAPLELELRETAATSDRVTTAPPTREASPPGTPSTFNHSYTTPSVFSPQLQPTSDGTSPLTVEGVASQELAVSFAARAQHMSSLH